MSIEPEELGRLPLADKLRIVEQLWDDIAASTEPFPIQSWQKAEIQRRSQELEQSPEIALTREEFWKRVGDANG